MKKRLFVILFIFLGMRLFAFEKKSITNYFNDYLYELLMDRASGILMGNIDFLDSNISDFDLAKLSNQDLRILRNAIYARHGNIFSSNDLTEYFSKFEWYKPTKKVNDSELTEFELNLIKRILIFETRDESKNTIKLEQTTGVWHSMIIMAAGWSNRFVFYSDNKLDYIFSQMRSLPIASEFHGEYEVKGNVLIFYVNEITYNDYTPIYKLIATDDLRDIESNRNCITFKNPLIFKFPIKTFEVKKAFYTKRDDNGGYEIYSDDSLHYDEEPLFYGGYMELGSFKYYRVREDTDKRY